jgi:hypothetical protein
MKTSTTATTTRPRLITLSKAVTETGIPRTSLIDLYRRGHLRFVRLPDSRRIWVLREDIDALIARSIEAAV